MTFWDFVFLMSLINGSMALPEEGQKFIYIPPPELAPEIYSGCSDRNENQNCWFVL